MGPFVRLSICGLSLAIVAVLIGCGGDKGSGDSQPDDGGRIGYVELDEGGEACLNKWNEPRNADAQAMAASSYPDTYTAVSFYEPVDSSNDCVALIAYPGYDNAAQFVSTAGAFEPFPSVTGQINEVVAEPLPWNAYLDSDGTANPRIEDGVPFDGIEVSPDMCVESWNQDFAATGTVSNTAGISGRADVGSDNQFPNLCLITVEFSDPVRGDFVTQWRDGSELGSTEWNLISDGSSAVIVDVYEPVAATVTPDGQIRISSEQSSDSSGAGVTGQADDCGTVVLEPNSDFGIFDLTVVGLSCDEASDELTEWISLRAQDQSLDSPAGWSCDSEDLDSALPRTRYECTRGDQALEFTL